MSKKRVSSSNLALRFYKCDGWTGECLNQYLLNGYMRDTEYAPHFDKPEIAYFSPNIGCVMDLERLYENEVSTVDRAYNDYPNESDLEFMQRHA